MLKKVLIVLLALCAAFVITVMLQPGEYRVERAATMAAAPAQVFAEVDDLHKWQAWSPWAKLDPKATATFEGPEAGVGAIFKWSGNQEVGEGVMTIVESEPSERIKIKTDFIKPFAGTSNSEFTFKPAGDNQDAEKTIVTWTMSGKNDFIGKAFCLFGDMDKMIGDSFEQGLANIKAIVEQGPPAAEAAPPVAPGKAVEPAAAPAAE